MMQNVGLVGTHDNGKDLTQQLVNKISEKDELQRKYLMNWKISASERNEFNSILHFFMEEFQYNMDYIADTYCFINQMVREETYYFIHHGKYRNSIFAEVNRLVYDNPEYMEKYMMGLAVSDYIWINHIKMLRYFEENLDRFEGTRYLEIGPGYGQYLIRALLGGKFEKYCACDISKTSVAGSNKFLKFRNLADRCMVEEKDFFEYNSEEFDCIVMGEVLEHVEQPLLMLKKIYGLLHKEGKAFITTVINAPTLDHIFLFGNIEQVLNLANETGFRIVDYMCSTEGDIPLEKAIKRKQAINVAMILEK